MNEFGTPTATPTEAPIPTAAPVTVKNKITNDLLVDEYRNGASVSKIVAEYGIGPARLYRALKAAGVPLRGKGRRANVNHEAIVADLLSGQRVSVIAHAHGVSTQTVYNIARQYAVTLPSKTPQVPTVTAPVAADPAPVTPEALPVEDAVADDFTTATIPAAAPVFVDDAPAPIEEAIYNEAAAHDTHNVVVEQDEYVHPF